MYTMKILEREPGLLEQAKARPPKQSRKRQMDTEGKPGKKGRDGAA